MTRGSVGKDAIPTLLILLLAAGCAAGPEAGRRDGPYGLEYADAEEALRRGQGREALRHYEEAALDLARRGQALEAAKAHGAGSFVALRLGAYQQAIRSGLRALELLQGVRPTQETVSRQADISTVVGHAYLLVGDLGEARRVFQKGLELTATLTDVGVILFQSAHLLRALASVAYSQGDYPAVIQHGGDAVRFLENFLVRLPSDSRFDELRHTARRDMAESLALVGEAHRQTRNFGEAEGLLQRALEIARGIRSQEMEAWAVGLLGGLVASSRQDYERALGQFQEALALAARLDHVPLLIALHAAIGRSHAEQGRLDEALGSLRRSLELVEDVRSQLQEAGLRGAFLEDKQAIYQRAVRLALALGRPDEAFSLAERGRARAFLDLLGNQATLSKGKTQALADEEARLRARVSAARTLAPSGMGREAPTRPAPEVKATERDYRAFLERVRKDNLEQASLMAVEPVTLQEVQSLLPEATLLLEYLVTDEEVLLWVIDRIRVEVLRLPLPRSALVTQVRAFRQAISERAPLPQVLTQARTLYEALLGAARPQLRAERLLIVPHDVLHYLPFGALRTPDQRWLVEEYPLTTLPSASVLKYLRDKGASASGRVLAVGNPDLGLALNLRFAEREARAVGERYPAATVLLRQEASEARVKALSGEVGLLHVAAHGELDEQDPLSSALLLVPEGTEDGRLEVREVFGLELNARLVVLSACETGLGKLSRGDELVGLQRAFLYAGTPAVVTTLWKVDDRASFVLMKEFYGQLETHGPAEALRLAQRATLQAFPHPFAWAAFSLAGVPR